MVECPCMGTYLVVSTFQPKLSQYNQIIVPQTGVEYVCSLKVKQIRAHLLIGNNIMVPQNILYYTVY